MPLGGFPTLVGGARWLADEATSLGRALGLPPNRLYEEWVSTRDPETWPEAPVSEGRPAMLIPGFLAGDPSLAPMARWLKSGGYELTRSGVRWNVDCMQPTVESIEARLEAAVEQAGQKALIVGQSRGGAMGRVIAVRRPDLVDTLVTLGSPLRDQTDVHPRVWFSIGLIGGLGSLGIPGFLSHSCAGGDCCRETRLAFGRPFPKDVRFISFYSRGDSIVRFQSCLDGAAEQIEIESSHLGMGLDSAVWERMAGELQAA
ncbi:MAG: alpha/beta hydrolase [Solirubrobacterales bacterium]|nr:alpha/beta hydrolase [Solirubrobacterales bacterium]